MCEKNVVRERVGRRQSINEGPVKFILLFLDLCSTLLTTKELDKNQDHGQTNHHSWWAVGRSMSLRKKHRICTMF